jgi:hypothetical protein
MRPPWFHDRLSRLPTLPRLFYLVNIGKVTRPFAWFLMQGIKLRRGPDKKTRTPALRRCPRYSARSRLAGSEGVVSRAAPCRVSRITLYSGTVRSDTGLALQNASAASFACSSRTRGTAKNTWALVTMCDFIRRNIIFLDKQDFRTPISYIREHRSLADVDGDGRS